MWYWTLLCTNNFLAGTYGILNCHQVYYFRIIIIKQIIGSYPCLLHNFGMTGPIQVGFSANSLNEDFNQIENGKCWLSTDSPRSHHIDSQCWLCLWSLCVAIKQDQCRKSHQQHWLNVRYIQKKKWISIVKCYNLFAIVLIMRTLQFQFNCS